MLDILHVILIVVCLGLIYLTYQLRFTIFRHEQTITKQSNELTKWKQKANKQQAATAGSTELLKTLNNYLYDLIFILDSDLKIVVANSPAEALFEGKNITEQHLGELLDSPDLEELLRHVVNDEELIEDQVSVGQRYFRLRATQVQHEQQQYLGVVLQDITQLVQLNRARRDMVANISHELRTPIAKIRLTIDSLFHDVDRPKRKDSIQSLKEIENETSTLQHILQELLDLSMIETGQAILKLVDVPIADVVDASLVSVEEHLEEKSLSLVRHVPAKLQVLCDPDQTKRVIVNLLQNAIKWSPEGEAITVSARASDDKVIISVFDNGPGVPDEHTGRIFERFYQVDDARSHSSNSGSGLGLAISKHIVEAHGGSIWAEGNSQGEGGRFMFTLLSDPKTNMDDTHELNEMTGDFANGFLKEIVESEPPEELVEENLTENS